MSALPVTPFVAPQGTVGPAFVSAVVGKEQYEGPFAQAEFLQLLDDLTDPLIHFLDHLSVGLLHIFARPGRRKLATDGALGLVIRPLVGIVRCLVRQVEAEGSVAVLLNELQRVLGNQVCRIAFFDGVLVLMPPVVVAGLIDVRKEVDVAADVPAERIEPMVDGVVVAIVSQVPLAKNGGGVTRLFQQLGKRRFGRLQTVVVHGDASGRRKPRPEYRLAAGSGPSSTRPESGCKRYRLNESR